MQNDATPFPPLSDVYDSDSCSLPEWSTAFAWGLRTGVARSTELGVSMGIAGAFGDTWELGRPASKDATLSTDTTSRDLPWPLRRRSTPEYTHVLPWSRRRHEPQGSRASHLILEALQAKHARQDRWRFSGRTFGRGIGDLMKTEVFPWIRARKKEEWWLVRERGPPRFMFGLDFTTDKRGNGANRVTWPINQPATATAKTVWNNDLIRRIRWEWRQVAPTLSRQSLPKDDKVGIGVKIPYWWLRCTIRRQPQAEAHYRWKTPRHPSHPSSIIIVE
jgi:hypothetical protein